MTLFAMSGDEVGFIASGIVLAIGMAFVVRTLWRRGMETALRGYDEVMGKPEGVQPKYNGRSLPVSHEASDSRISGNWASIARKGTHS